MVETSLPALALMFQKSLTVAGMNIIFSPAPNGTAFVTTALLGESIIKGFAERSIT